VICLKAGAIVFGTGLAIIPVLEADFVQRLGWLNHAEFLTALAMGQITPGPVVITVAHIGYKQLGLLGAIVATISIFLPSFIHMTTWFPKLVNKLNQYEWIGLLNTVILSAVVSSLFYSIIVLIKNYNALTLMSILALSILQLRFKLSLFPTLIIALAVLSF
jgi:chromate transporter